jgi:hypothetical protein
MAGVDLSADLSGEEKAGSDIVDRIGPALAECGPRFPTSANEGTSKSSTDKIITKYLSLTESVYGTDSAIRIKDILYDVERHHVSELMALVQ